MNEDQKRHFDNALRNLKAMYNHDLAGAFDLEEAGRPMPVGAVDPLEYLGSLTPLKLDGAETDRLRGLVIGWVEDMGPEWVWSNRERTKMEIATFGV